MTGPETSKVLRYSLSPSVLNAMSALGDQRPVTAAEFMRTLFSLHKEYAGGKVTSLHLKDTSTTRTSREWVNETETLFELEPIQLDTQSESETVQDVRDSEPPTFHGRLLVLGLALLEPGLREQLESADAFSALVEELQEPLVEILSQRGLALYDLLDSVPNWSDDPLLSPEDDLLGRKAFARFLARRIEAIPPRSGAYTLHIYGPWGAGKTTLLNFLGAALEQQGINGKLWLVVEFNAWRNQQIQPPWWSLMEQVFKATKKRLSSLDRFHEYWWRFNTGRLQYVVAVIVLAWLLALVVFPLLRTEAGYSGMLSDLGINAENLSKLLALIATIWGSILAVNRSLLLGSAQAAKTYTELTHDPTTEIKNRFNGLIKKLSPDRVAILVDDLDRCQSRYVVDLLEGIQTLFRDAPVVFVIAADRHWLNACYEEVYEKLEPRIHEPGKPLGTLFLEKAFRFSTPMPGMSDELRNSYWRHLLQLAPQGSRIDATAARQSAMDDVAKAHSEYEVRSMVESSRGLSFAEQRAIREEAAVRLAAPEVLERIEHALKPYAHLLEPNPRAMKLFVNSYSANRALAILSEVEIDLHQLALWTILSSRWPILADYFSEYPEMLERIGQPNLPDLTNEMKALFADSQILLVVKGLPAHGPLNFTALKECIRIRS